MNRSDPSGEAFWSILAGAVVNATFSIATQYATDGSVNWGKVAFSAVAGAASGIGFSKLIVGACVGAAAGIADSVVSNWGSSMSTTEKVVDAVISGGMGALTNLTGSAVNVTKLDSMTNLAEDSIKAVFSKNTRKSLKKVTRRSFKKAGKYILKSFGIYTAEGTAYNGMSRGTSWYFQRLFSSWR